IRAADGANPNDIRVNVDLTQPGLLVISNVWYPGWSAVVDGRAQPVERVDATFQRVYLPAGSHDVRLIFAPASLRVGLALAAIGLLLAAIGLAIDRRSCRRGQGE